MILPDMTCEQMITALQNDIYEVQNLSCRFMVQQGTKTLRSPKAVFPCSIVHIETCPTSKQRYMFVHHFSNRSEAFNIDSRYSVRALINTQYGTEMAEIVHIRNETNVLYYRAHLFHRYAERMGLHMTGDEILRYFSKRNGMMIEAVNWRTENDCMIMCHDGSCFGEFDPDDHRRIFLKTFIATETMQDETRRSYLNGMYDEAFMQTVYSQYLKGDEDLAHFLMTNHKRRKDK